MILGRAELNLKMINLNIKAKQVMFLVISAIK